MIVCAHHILLKMGETHRITLLILGLLCAAYTAQAQSCGGDSDCSSGQCCVGDGSGGPRTCQALSSAGQSCPAPGSQFPPDRCGCDSSSVCRVPITGAPPRFGTCELKPILLPGGKCYTNRNCNFGDCCVGRWWRRGSCMALGRFGQKCTDTAGQSKHRDACPCVDFSRCETIGPDGTGQCSEQLLPP